MFDSTGSLFIPYDQNMVYSDRIHHALNTIADEYVLYLHEDMILYNEPKLQEMVNLVNKMESMKIDFVRFCINKGTKEHGIDGTNLRNYEGEYYFSVQPTMWKKSSFIQFINGENKSIWDLELYSQQKCRNTCIGYTYAFLNEKQRGMGHKDSLIFPYTATAVVKGKWNTAEYNYELSEIFREYQIDVKIRGTNED